VPKDDGSARRDEATDVMRCIRESLWEPVFMQVLVRLASGNGQSEECETASPSQLEPFATKWRATVRG
jgi:hypothetical protein